jgi:hypothetical protein
MHYTAQRCLQSFRPKDIHRKPGDLGTQNDVDRVPALTWRADVIRSDLVVARTRAWFPCYSAHGS